MNIYSANWTEDKNPIIQLEPKRDNGLSNYTHLNSLQTIDNIELDGLTEGACPIVQLDDKTLSNYTSQIARKPLIILNWTIGHPIYSCPIVQLDLKEVLT